MNSSLHLVGLSRKAGRLAIGEEPVGQACRTREAKLILLASDAAENSVRRACHAAESANALWLELPFTKAELGDAVGRASCAVLAMTDAGLASALAEKLAWEDPERCGAVAETLKKRAQKALERQKQQRALEKKRLEAQRSKPWAAPVQARGAGQPRRPRKKNSSEKPSRHHET